MNLIFSQSNPARIFPKQISGASGGFLPRPLLLRLRHPNSKKNQPRFCQILSPENSFGKTESALVLPPARSIEGRPPKKNVLSFFKKNFILAKSRKQETFFFGVAERSEAGAGRFIHPDWFQKRFEFCIMNTANFQKGFQNQKYGRREAPSVLYSPHKILILQGFATLRVAPRLPIQFQFYE
jgi:hypothetical protein